MWRAVWVAWRRWRSDDRNGARNSDGSAQPQPLVGQDLQGSNNLQVGTANDVSSTTLNAGAGSVQVHAGGEVHVHITLAQDQLEADAQFGAAFRNATSQRRAGTQANRRLTPSQRDLLLGIRNLPSDKEQAMFIFMEKHLGTRMVRDLDEVDQRRLRRYLEMTWETVHQERLSGRRND